MIADGELTVETVAPGEFRWSYVTVNGAMFLGARLWGSKSSARKDGRQWLEQQRLR